jgi:hypothetical protein
MPIGNALKWNILGFLQHYSVVSLKELKEYMVSWPRLKEGTNRKNIRISIIFLIKNNLSYYKTILRDTAWPFSMGPIGCPEKSVTN